MPRYLPCVLCHRKLEAGKDAFDVPCQEHGRHRLCYRCSVQHGAVAWLGGKFSVERMSWSFPTEHAACVVVLKVMSALED